MEYIQCDSVVIFCSILSLPYVGEELLNVNHIFLLLFLAVEIPARPSEAKPYQEELDRANRQLDEVCLWTAMLYFLTQHDRILSILFHSKSLGVWV